MGYWATFFFPNAKASARLPLTWPPQSWAKEPPYRWCDICTAGHKNVGRLTENRVFYFTWQQETLPLSCSRSISLKYLPSAHPFICGDNRAHGLLCQVFLAACREDAQSKRESKRETITVACVYLNGGNEKLVVSFVGQLWRRHQT